MTSIHHIIAILIVQAVLSLYTIYISEYKYTRKDIISWFIPYIGVAILIKKVYSQS